MSVMPPGPVTVKEGKSLSLECLGRGEPRPLVRWSRLGSRQKVEHQTLLHMDSQAVLQVNGAPRGAAGTETCRVLTTHRVPSPALAGQAGARRDLHLHGTQRPGLGASPCGRQCGDCTEAPRGPRGHRTACCHRGGWGDRHAALLSHRYGVGTVAGVRGHLPGPPLPRVTDGDIPAGEPAPRIEWSKLRAPLPWQHRVVNGSLVIPRAAQQDSGQYICNASSPAGSAEVFVTLDVESKGAAGLPLPQPTPCPPSRCLLLLLVPVPPHCPLSVPLSLPPALFITCAPLSRLCPSPAPSLLMLSHPSLPRGSVLLHPSQRSSSSPSPRGLLHPVLPRCAHSLVHLSAHRPLHLCSLPSPSVPCSRIHLLLIPARSHLGSHSVHPFLVHLSTAHPSWLTSLPPSPRRLLDSSVCGSGSCSSIPALIPAHPSLCCCSHSSIHPFSSFLHPVCCPSLCTTPALHLSSHSIHPFPVGASITRPSQHSSLCVSIFTHTPPSIPSSPIHPFLCTSIAISAHVPPSIPSPWLYPSAPPCARPSLLTRFHPALPRGLGHLSPTPAHLHPSPPIATLLAPSLPSLPRCRPPCPIAASPRAARH